MAKTDRQTDRLTNKYFLKNRQINIKKQTKITKYISMDRQAILKINKHAYLDWNKNKIKAAKERQA